MKVNYILTKSFVSDVRNLEKSGTASKYRNYIFHKHKTRDVDTSRIDVEYVAPIRELNTLGNYEISVETSYNCEGNELVVENGYTCISVEFNSFGENDSAVNYHFHKNLPNSKYATICVHDIGDSLHPEFVVGKQYTLVIK